MSKNGYRTIELICPKCGVSFLPFGSKRVSETSLKDQVFANFKCPECKNNFMVWYDIELKKDFIRKELGLESKEKDIDERIKTITELMNTFLGLESNASLEEVKMRAKEIGETWDTLIHAKNEVNEKKKKWFGSNEQ